MKNTITEIKNSLEGLINIFELAEVRVSELEYKSMAIIQSEEQKGKRMKKNEETQRPMENH